MRLLVCVTLLVACPTADKTDAAFEEDADSDADSDADPDTDADTLCSMRDYFPQDGEREALYYNEDPEIEWTLRAEQGSDGLWSYENDGDGTIIGSIRWDSDDGIEIAGWSEGTESVRVVDPPFVVAGDCMRPGETIETGAWSSTFVGMENCPVQWGIDGWECVRLRLENAGEEAFFLGDWWLVTRYGPAWMHLAGFTEKWNLADYDFSEDG